jgi:DNA-binding HxlR family transcriptional regulator
VLDRERHPAGECPIARGVGLIGDKWTLLIVRDLSQEQRRFGQLLRSLAGISSRTLSCRLDNLEQAGLINRQAHPEAPVRVEYSLTPKGRALLPLIEMLRVYGEKWLKQGS